MGYGRLFVVKLGNLFAAPAKKGQRPAAGPLSEARFYPSMELAREAASESGGVAVAVDLAVNTSVQTYFESDGRFSFSRNGLSCDPPPGWRTLPSEARVPFLTATGWIRT